MKEKLKKYLKKECLITAGVGLVLGLVIMLIIGFVMKATGIAKLKYGSDTVATVNGKSVNAESIYEKLKVSGGLSILLNDIDKVILDDMFTLTEKEEEDAKEDMEEYIEYYTAMGYSEKSILASVGATNKEEFLEIVKTSEKSNKYLYNYLEGKLEEGAVQKYYDEHKEEIESYDSEHVLVRITDTVTDEQALALANEILNKINDGKTFDDIEEEYGNQIVREHLGFQSKTASLEQPYLDELIALEDGAYSKTPVKTSYGYHIVHRLSTATFEDLRESIIEILSSDLLQNDANLTKKALIELRKEKGFKIYDEELDKQYQEYIDNAYTDELSLY